MKVIVLGLPRTGTQSLADALEHIGFGPVYHMREVAKLQHQQLWIEAIEAKFEGKGKELTREDFDKIMDGFEGLSDYPASIFPTELMAAYPEAKIILTTRPEDGWYASMLSTLWHQQSRRAADDPHPLNRLARKYHRHCWADDFPANGRRLFRRHNELVREEAGRLGRDVLEYQPGAGWAPLCRFLGVPEVPRVPYPRSDEWNRYRGEVAAGSEAEGGKREMGGGTV